MADHVVLGVPLTGVCNTRDAFGRVVLKLDYTDDVLALWNTKDEEAAEKWRQEKIADFEAGGAMKQKHETAEKLNAWMDEKIYAPGGSKDKTLKMRGNPKCYFDIDIGGRIIGRIIMQLRKDVVPKTAENFRQLCTGEPGFGYSGSIFHRVVPQFMCQGGDFTNHDGKGGKSIYGETFEDENFTLKHTGPGILSMANAGPDTNGSQFFLSTCMTDFLDGKNVVFGKVVKGRQILSAIEALGSQSGETSKKVTIVACGEISPSSPQFLEKD